MFPANLRPGQGFVRFTVWKKQGGVTDTGRAKASEYTETEQQFFGMLTSTSPREAEQWKQNGHPVSHKIVEYGALVQAIPTDYLVLENGRKFYVQGTKNHGNFGVCISYYVEERRDLQ